MDGGEENPLPLPPPAASDSAPEGASPVVIAPPPTPKGIEKAEDLHSHGNKEDGEEPRHGNVQLVAMETQLKQLMGERDLAEQQLQLINTEYRRLLAEKEVRLGRYSV